MMMRYYVGLAVGHTYAHGQASVGVDQQATDGTCEAAREGDLEFEPALSDSHITNCY
jgi:hypothetical protein